MRGLQTHDVFVALKIANSAGVREEIKSMSLRVANGEKLNVQEVGFEFIFNLLGNCTNDKTEAQLYQFFGGLLEIEPESIKTMDPLELINKIKGLKEVISTEEWKSFFQSLSALIQK